MARGKQTCKILKEIRRQIAEANGIKFVTSECRYKGDCLGTCPKCEAEVRYLEQQLRARSLAGKVIALAGISAASLAMLIPMTSQAQTLQEPQNVLKGSIPVMADTITVRGVALRDRSNNLEQAHSIRRHNGFGWSFWIDRLYRRYFESRICGL